MATDTGIVLDDREHRLGPDAGGTVPVEPTALRSRGEHRRAASQGREPGRQHGAVWVVMTVLLFLLAPVVVPVLVLRDGPITSAPPASGPAGQPGDPTIPRSGPGSAVPAASTPTAGRPTATSVSRSPDRPGPVAEKSLLPEATPTPQIRPRTSTSTLAPRPALAQAPKIAITAPPDGTTVSRNGGFIVEGTITGSLGSWSVWLLDDHAGGYYVDMQATVQGDRWSAADRPLGSPSEALPFDLSAVAVLADPACAAALAASAAAGNQQMAALPAGCRVVDSVSVVVNRR